MSYSTHRALAIANAHGLYHDLHTEIGGFGKKPTKTQQKYIVMVEYLWKAVEGIEQQALTVSQVEKIYNHVANTKKKARSKLVKDAATPYLELVSNLNELRTKYTPQ